MAPTILILGGLGEHSSLNRREGGSDVEPVRVRHVANEASTGGWEGGNGGGRVLV